MSNSKTPRILTALYFAVLALMPTFTVAEQTEIKKESPDIIIKLRNSNTAISLDELESNAVAKKRQAAQLKQEQRAAAAQARKDREREKALAEQDRLYAAKLEKEYAETEHLTALDLFNKNLTISFQGATFGVSAQQERAFIVKYFVDNKGGKALKLARWTAVFKNGDEQVFSYDIGAHFETPFQPETRKEVILTLKLKDLPETMQQTLSDPNAKINVVSVARELVFDDETKIQVN